MDTTYSQQMLTALANEDLASAQLAFNQALVNDQPEDLTDLGSQLMQLGFLEEAQQIFENLLEKFPENAELQLSLAEIAIENDQIDTAFDYIESVDKNSEFYPEALLLSADLYQVLGIPEVSEAKLNEAAKILPDEPLIQFALAELYFNSDRFSDAATLYQLLLNAGVQELAGVSLEERLGSALSLEGKFEDAVTHLERALKEEVTDDRLFQTAFVYLQLKENQQAINYLQQLRALNPQYQSLYLYLAQALQEEELLEEAQETIEEGIKENPFQVDFYQFASENAYRLHDEDKAEEFLLKALETGEKTDETRLMLSNLYLKAERFEDVITTIEKMENPDDAFAQWNLAHAYNELEDFTEAAVHYEQANLSLHHEPEFMKEYGIFLREEGRLEEALSLLTHYLSHEPGDLEVQSIIDALTER
ncbi:tetratricopeptide repeat protein [Enterococcus mediterraneensis]|uniref:tetratricopeptide repeat protein n=1 Tax=Enterococcus mediterraneensis TaxID=2364791 RepID=UPI000F0550E1|nr:tetratricopeptide repeat protein [Enterococcus mediterraneensis]